MDVHSITDTQGKPHVECERPILGGGGNPRTHTKLFTSYYSSPKLATLDFSRFIPISRGIPRGFLYNFRLMELAPTWSMIHLSESEYIPLYERILNDVLKNDVYKILQKLPDNAILLCYEKPPKFCHRHLVATWIYNSTGIIIEEL